MRRLIYIILVFISVFALYVGSELIRIESAVFDYGPYNDPYFAEKQVNDNIDVGISNYSTKRLMQNCIFGLQDPQAVIPAKRQFYAFKCRDSAEAVLRYAPFNAFALLVKAYASNMVNDQESLNQTLLLSWNSAPNEQWIAVQRYNLVADNFLKLKPEYEAKYNQDLALLAQSPYGVKNIAKRYIQQPDFRERVTDIVEKLPADVQQRFLNNVRVAAKKYSGQ